ncbi:MAG: polysaccharide biosynthesis tyrosine autokinase [Fibrobacter sp.]|uniref:polysaccharide biosynthesis tyrosine autokinase n=1 Tax=Fibrobacter sp. TaxID=35828 RepID=UPI0025C1A493|nr:polysaccharide biosynthesis tyrosine autokinase [Fibrobacter sp.]MBQ9224894.1 polysaccharide biosynthesis tyrosine autokinase [Fibrobacter sp.]
MAEKTVEKSPVPKDGADKSIKALSIVETVDLLWKNKFLILFFVVIAGLVGVLYGLWQRPQYTSDLLLQVNTKGSGNKATKALGEMGAVLEMYSPADAEIELIKSRMVLSYVVESEHLNFIAEPMGFIDRLTHNEGRMDLDSLKIPMLAHSGKWIVEVVSEDEFAVISPEEKEILRGKVDELKDVPYRGDIFTIKVRKMHAKPGQRFLLKETTPLNAERTLYGRLSVVEKGKQTGIIAVRFSHRYPDRAAAILNTIARTYLRQNVEMRSAEAEKTLEFLEGQLPGVKAKLDSAEKVLADYRFSIGSVDMTGETKAHLNKEVDLQKQILELEQKKQAAMRLFKAEHPSIVTIVKQQTRLRAELAQLKKNAEKMPLTQQEVTRLQEEVAVNNEVYTNMLNNIQQLRVVRAGEVGNVRIVDFAQVESIQSKPKKFNIFVFSVGAGFAFGVFFVFLMYVFKNGVRRTAEIERETGLSVLAKIPQLPSKLLHKRVHHNAPFVLQNADDRVSESFRSLQTALGFLLPQPEHSIVLIMGLTPGVGKSFVSLNLASTIAASGKRVLLIDADMRRGVIHSGSKFGLADVLLGLATIDTATVQKYTDNLFVMNAGKTKIAACELLRSDAMDKLLKEARNKFDMVVVDTPPLNLVTDAELIYPLIDYSLLVLHYGRHGMDEIKETVERMRRYSDKPGAIVMNHCEYELGHYGYGYYGKGYYSK